MIFASFLDSTDRASIGRSIRSAHSAYSVKRSPKNKSKNIGRGSRNNRTIPWPHQCKHAGNWRALRIGTSYIKIGKMTLYPVCELDRWDSHRQGYPVYFPAPLRGWPDGKIHNAYVRHALPREPHQSSADQNQTSLDEWSG